MQILYQFLKLDCLLSWRGSQYILNTRHLTYTRFGIVFSQFAHCAFAFQPPSPMWEKQTSAPALLHQGTASQLKMHGDHFIYIYTYNKVHVSPLAKLHQEPHRVVEEVSENVRMLRNPNLAVFSSISTPLIAVSFGLDSKIWEKWICQFWPVQCLLQWRDQ